MRRLIISILILSIFLTAKAQAQPVKESDARIVASNWIKLIITKQGDWGGSKTAGIRKIQEFKQGGRTVGYYCSVSPKGNIIISLRRELSPVLAYSEVSDMDPVSDKHMTGFIKRNMERVLNKLDKQNSMDESAKSKKEEMWMKLEQDVQIFASGLDSGAISLAYQPSTYLLSSNWHQGSPYNLECPGGDTCAHCPVGCVALAGAQIMRYWAWPPENYNWQYMPDVLIDDGTHPEWINEVSYLCAYVGYQAGVDYSCDDGSDAWCADKAGKDMLDAFEDHFRYNPDGYFNLRINYGNESWFNIIKDNINQNRPLQYCTCEYDFPGTAGHSLVLDGWKEISGVFYGHMNDGLLEWVDMTDMPGAEGMIKNVKPFCAMGSWLSGDPPDDPVVYTVPGHPYRYFDQDATGRNVTFVSGHNLQFLPGVTVRGTSPVGDHIKFYGTPAYNTRLFSIKGTTDGGLDAGVKIYDGEIRLYNNGSIRFH